MTDDLPKFERIAPPQWGRYTTTRAWHSSCTPDSCKHKQALVRKARDKHIARIRRSK